MILSISRLRQNNEPNSTLDRVHREPSSQVSSSLGNNQEATSPGDTIKKSSTLVAPFKRSLSTAYTRQTYYELVQQMKQKIVIKDRQHHFKTYKSCFLAKDAVTLTEEYLKLSSRNEALKVCQEMTEKIQCWEHVCDERQTFQDNGLLLRFTSDSKRQSGTLSQVILSRRNKAKEGPPSLSFTQEESEEMCNEGSKEEEKVAVPPQESSPNAGPGEGLSGLSDSFHSKAHTTRGCPGRSRSTDHLLLAGSAHSPKRQPRDVDPVEDLSANGISASLHSTRACPRRSKSSDNLLLTGRAHSPKRHLIGSAHSPKRQPRTRRTGSPNAHGSHQESLSPARSLQEPSSGESGKTRRLPRRERNGIHQESLSPTHSTQEPGRVESGAMTSKTKQMPRNAPRGSTSNRSGGSRSPIRHSDRDGLVKRNTPPTGSNSGGSTQEPSLVESGTMAPSKTRRLPRRERNISRGSTGSRSGGSKSPRRQSDRDASVPRSKSPRRHSDRNTAVTSNRSGGSKSPIRHCDSVDLVPRSRSPRRRSHIDESLSNRSGGSRSPKRHSDSSKSLKRLDSDISDDGSVSYVIPYFGSSLDASTKGELEHYASYARTNSNDRSCPNLKF